MMKASEMAASLIALRDGVTVIEKDKSRIKDVRNGTELGREANTVHDIRRKLKCGPLCSHRSRLKSTKLGYQAEFRQERNASMQDPARTSIPRRDCDISSL